MAGKAKTDKKVVKKTKSSPKKEETVTEPVSESVPQVESSTVATEQAPDELELLMNSILARHEHIEKEQKLLKTETKKLVKVFAKKYNKKKKKASSGSTKAPSGFAKPAPISDELCAFLGKEKGTELARTEVTKHLNVYIKQHNLQDEKNKRSINPDTKLKELLKLKEGESVTYFNLQKYMKLHFPKKEQSVSV